ncbi:MAG: hypothetical protein U0930_09875 [Pirellulales bacterium]
MQVIKNTQRAQVARNYSGSFTKFFNGPSKVQRFRNEVRVLQFLNSQSCPFVPSLLAFDEVELSITTSYAGEPIQRITEERLSGVFEELQEYGVRHDDPAQRNVLYNHALGRFTLIDFEFAEILEPCEATLEAIDGRFDRLEAVIDEACVI